MRRCILVLTLSTLSACADPVAPRPATPTAPALTATCVYAWGCRCVKLGNGTWIPACYDG